MTVIHATPYERAGTTHDWNGQPFIVEDWWDRVYGKPWGTSDNNPAALIYAMRLVGTNIPWDDEVVYGKDPRGFGHLVHVSELKAAEQ